MTVIILRLRQHLFFHCLSIYCCVTRSLVLKTAALVLTAFVSILLAVAFNFLPEGKANLLFALFCLMVFQHESGGSISQSRDGK